MNQTIKNMDEVILKLKQSIYTDILEGNYKYESTQIAKTLINTYQTMLNTFMQMTNVELKESNAFEHLEKQAKEIYITVNTIESVTIPNLIDYREFKGVDNMSLVVDKARKIIRSICPRKDFMEEVKSSMQELNEIDNEESYDNTYKLLEQSIKNKILVMQTDDSLRGTGKTTACIKKAHELDCLILTMNNVTKGYTSKIADDLCLYVLTVSATNLKDLSLPQYSSQAKNGIIVDEVRDKEVLRYLKDKGCTILGGFTS